MKTEQKPRPKLVPGRPFAYFQWNYGWGIWEQVYPEAAGKPGVIAAYVSPNEGPASLSPSPPMGGEG